MFNCSRLVAACPLGLCKTKSCWPLIQCMQSCVSRGQSPPQNILETIPRLFLQPPCSDEPVWTKQAQAHQLLWLQLVLKATQHLHLPLQRRFGEWHIHIPMGEILLEPSWKPNQLLIHHLHYFSGFILIPCLLLFGFPLNTFFWVPKNRGSCQIITGRKWECLGLLDIVN